MMAVNKDIPCKLCEGKGLVYGMDGKPYLCPKCDGDKYDKDKTTYPQPYYPPTPYVPIWPSYPWTVPFVTYT
jgi:hypothetical protein